MASNKVLIEVIVSDNGTAKLVTKGIDSVGVAADNTRKRVKGASAAQDEFNYKLNQGATGVSSAARSFSKLNQTIGNGPNGLVGAYATLAANAFAVSAAFNTLRNAAQVEQLLKGLEVQGERTGRTLTVTAKALKEVTNNAISAEDAMRTAAQGAAAGISSVDLTKLTKGATDAAVALGRNVPDALDRVIKGVTKLEPELLDELGVMTKLDEATRAYAQTLGKAPSALSNMERRQGYLVAVSAELERKFKGISEEAGVNVYDQLGAAFSNLTKDVLNTINGITPLVEAIRYLSESSLGLGAILVMFAGTVSKQVLPSLYQMGESAQKSASELAELGKQKLNNVKAAHAQAKADNETVLAQLKQFNIVEQNKKLFTEYVTDLNKGTATTSQYTKAVRSLTGQIGYYNKVAGENPTTKKELEAKQLVSIFEQQKAQLLKLKDTDEIQAASIIRNRSLVKAAKLEAIAVSRLEAAATAESSMLQSAGNLQVATTYGFLKKSVIDYVASLKLKQAAEATTGTSTNAFFKLGDAIGAAGSKLADFIKAPISSITNGFNTLTAAVSSAGGMLNFLKGGFRGLTLAVKAFGTALAAAIPVIGEILLLIDLIIEFGPKIWSYLTGKKENEALKSALEENEEILKRTQQTAVRINRVFQDQGASASQTADALRALSNTVNEVVDSYQSIQQAKNAPDQLVKGLTEISKKQKELGGKSINLSGISNTQEFKAVAAIYSTGYDTIKKKIEAATVGSKAFMSSTRPEQVELLTKLLADVKNEYGDLANNLDSLRDAYRELDKSSTEFGLSLAKSTPYDKMVEALSKSIGAVGDLQQKMQLGIITANDFSNQVAQLGEASTSNIGKEAQVKLSALKSTEAQLVVARKLADTYKDDEQLQNRAAALANNRNDQAQELEPILTSSLLKTQATLEALQSQDRSLQSITKLEEARNKRINTYLGKTKQSAQLQDEQADRMRSLEAKRIDLQINQLKNQRTSIELKQEEFLLQDKINKARVQELITQKQSLQEQLKRLSTQKLTVDFNLKSSDPREFQERYRREIIDRNRPDKIRYVDVQAEQQFEALSKQLTGANAEIEQLQRSLVGSASTAEAFRLQLKGIDDSITAATTDRATIFADKLSAAEIAARDIGLDMDIVMGFLQEVAVQQSIVSSLKEKELKLTSSISQNILTQLTISQLQLKTNRENLNLEAKQQAQSLINRRDILKVAISTGNYQGKSLEMLKAELNVVNATLLQLQQTYRLKDAELLLDLRLQLVEQARFDTLSEGIQMQQKALQVIEQEAKIREDLLNTEQQIRSVRTQIAYARQGLEVPEEVTKFNDYTVAKESYALFQQNLSIRMKGIELEYALLEAQRIQTVLELSYKKKILDLELQRAQREAGTDPVKLKAIAEERTMLKQLDSALSTITKTTYEGNKQLAIEALNAEGRLKAANVELARLKMVGGTGVDTQVAQIFAAAETLRTVFKDTPRQLSSVGDSLFAQVEDTTKAVIPDLGAVLSDNLSELDRKFSGVSDLGSIFKISTEALVTELEKLNGNIDGLLETVIGKSAMEALRTSRAQASSSSSDSNSRQEKTLAAFNYGKSQGFRVDELKGVTPVGRHSGIRGAGEVGHYAGTAFDVNIGEGNVEWENPGQKRRMDELANYYRSIGATVLWGVKDHYDHMHVEFMRNTQATVESSITSVANTATRSVERETAAVGEEAKALIGKVPSSVIMSQVDNAAPITSSTPVQPTSSNITSDFNIDIAKTSENFGKSYIANTFGTAQEISAFTEASKAQIGKLNSDLVEKATAIGNILKEELFSKPLDPEAYANALTEFKTRFNAEVLQTADYMRKNAFPAADLADKVSGFWAKATPLMQPFMDGLKKLGPQGELVAAAFGGIQTLSTSITQFAKDVESSGVSLENVASLASTALSVIQSVTSAASNAKIASIDKEIAAEQKRDGKSAASVAKLDALEKKKDAIARKQFNTNKKISMAQAVIATATGVAEALKWGFPMGPIAAGIIGAMGLAQIAMIAGTQYESTYTPKAVQTPTSLSIGKRSDTIDLAKGPNANAGGEAGFLRGTSGMGSNASNYRTIGSAYGGDLNRGYGNRGFVVGEKGPEVINPETPITVTPANEVQNSQPLNATFNIQALDASGVQDILVSQKGNIIKMLRDAANASGQRFMEDVNVNVYTRPNVGKL